MFAKKKGLLHIHDLQIERSAHALRRLPDERRNFLRKHYYRGPRELTLYVYERSLKVRHIIVLVCMLVVRKTY